MKVYLECALDLLSVYRTDGSVAESLAGQGFEPLKYDKLVP
jgi:hypothetical protein